MSSDRPSSATHFLRALFAWSCILCVCAIGAEGPKQTGKNSDVVHLENNRTDYEMRMWAIRNAKKSVDFIGFSLPDDEVAIGLTQAMRQASNNGVLVRAMYEMLPSVDLAKLKEMDPGAFAVRSAQFLADSNLQTPAQVVVGRTMNKWRNGMAWDDFIHRKVLIIDRGTPNEMIFFGGRAMNATQATFKDSAFLIRPVDATKPHVGQDIGQGFDRLWDTLKKVHGIEKPAPVDAKLLEKVNRTPPTFVTTDSQRAELEALKKLAAKPPSASDVLAPNQFRPESMQYVTNDLTENLQTRRWSGGLLGRARLPNDILSHAVDFVRGQSEIGLTAYSIVMPPTLRSAVQDLIRRGGTANFYTNGRKAHEVLTPGGLAVHLTYQDLIPFYAEIAGAPGSANLFILDLDKGRTDPNGESTYVHRKLLLGGDTVLSGSDNFTLSAARKNEEDVIVFKDQRLADYMRGLTQSELEHYNRVDEADLARRYKARPFYFKMCAGALRRLW